MERRRSRSPKRSHRHRSTSSERRHKHSHRKHKHHHQKKHHKSPRSPSPPRYKFDSPPKTYLAYNKQMWSEYQTATNPEEFINKIQQVASTIPSSQANKIDRELYIGNLPSGITGTQLVDLLNRTLISIGANICVIFI
jgi:ABC-type Zn2+ transport system substrate-binding protein/surface adhesin